MILKLFKFRFSSVPIIDTTNFLNANNYQSSCKEVAQALHHYGSVIIKDPRVNQADNAQFLDMMENYFTSRGEKFYKNERIEDFFPNYNYQVGATPEFVEQARPHQKVVSTYKTGHESYTSQPPSHDAKWRFFWPLNETDINKKNEDFNPPRFAPKDFPEWESKMNKWGQMMINGCMTVAEMTAIGLDMPKDSFSSLMRGAPHLLAPTGSDLKRYDVGTVFAGFHYDLNFLTIHGKSRYPGLYVWLRNGERITVSVPEGHLLLQAGKQFELLTGGYITCGYHEVIYTEGVKARLEDALKKGQSWWRVSSTLFSHIASHQQLAPIGKFDTEENRKNYPPITAGEQVLKELEAINLAS